MQFYSFLFFLAVALPISALPAPQSASNPSSVESVTAMEAARQVFEADKQANKQLHAQIKAQMQAWEAAGKPAGQRPKPTADEEATLKKERQDAEAYEKAKIAVANDDTAPGATRVTAAASLKKRAQEAVARLTKKAAKPSTPAAGTPPAAAGSHLKHTPAQELAHANAELAKYTALLTTLCQSNSGAKECQA